MLYEYTNYGHISDRNHLIELQDNWIWCGSAQIAWKPLSICKSAPNDSKSTGLPEKLPEKKIEKKHYQIFEKNTTENQKTQPSIRKCCQIF